MPAPANDTVIRLVDSPRQSQCWASTIVVATSHGGIGTASSGSPGHRSALPGWCPRPQP